MTEVTTVSGRVHKIQGFIWEVHQDGSLVVVNKTSGGFKTVFASGQWESVKEIDN